MEINTIKEVKTCYKNVILNHKEALKPIMEIQATLLDKILNTPQSPGMDHYYYILKPNGKRTGISLNVFEDGSGGYVTEWTGV